MKRGRPIHVDDVLFWAIEETLAFFRSHGRQASVKISEALGISAPSLRQLRCRFLKQLNNEDLEKLKALHRRKWVWVISPQQAAEVEHSEHEEELLDKKIQKAEAVVLKRLKTIRNRSS